MFFCLLVLAACGTPRTEWPAHIASLNGFSSDESKEILASIEKLNGLSDKPLLTTTGDPTLKTYLIHVTRSNPWPDEPMTAGITMREDEVCHVELSTELFKSEREDYVDSVVWHELGHCAGLRHNPKAGSMMFATAKPFTLFSNDSLKSFILDVENSLSSEALGH